MDKVDTLLRKKNVKFLLHVQKTKTSKDAARSAGITPQHGRKIMRKWVEAGWIERRPTLHGPKYFLTSKGETIVDALAVTLYATEK